MAKDYEKRRLNGTFAGRPKRCN